MNAEALRLLPLVVVLTLPACAASRDREDATSFADAGARDTRDATDASDATASRIDAAESDTNESDAAAPDAAARDGAARDAAAPDGSLGDAGGSLAPCGDDTWCAANEYCDFTESGCIAPGQCRARPTACPPSPHGADPVCGCNGRSFASTCEAARAGVDAVEYLSACDGYPTIACGPARACTLLDQYCEIAPGTAPGAVRYACRPLPSSCTFSFMDGAACSECFPDAGARCDDSGIGLTLTLEVR